ncbi:hypothetical protein SESBI_33357 [Sesbania bispinosa]|nr:hypothetical protein SESBI_33357 [Sesbania bispinosa]
MGIPEGVKVDEGVEEIPGCDLRFRKRCLCEDTVISPCELTGHSSSGNGVPLVGTPYLSQIQNLRTALHISCGRYVPYSEVFRLARVRHESPKMQNFSDFRISSCSKFGSLGLGAFLPMYKNLFEDLGVRLPFSDFEGEVLQFLQVAPSPLHPNGWSFIKCFQMLCEVLDLPCTLDLFCHMFSPFRVVDKDDGDMPVSNQARLLKKREKKAILQVATNKSLTVAANDGKASPRKEPDPKRQKVTEKASGKSPQASSSLVNTAATKFLFSGKSGWTGPNLDEKIAQDILSKEYRSAFSVATPKAMTDFLSQICVWGLRSAAMDEFFKYSVKELSTLPEIKENMTKLTEKLRDDEVEMKAMMAKVKKLEEDHEKDG